MTEEKILLTEIYDRIFESGKIDSVTHEELIERIGQNISKEEEEENQHILVIVRDGIVSEIYSEQPNVKVTVMDIDQNADDPAIIQDEQAEIPDNGIQSIIDNEEQKMKDKLEPPTIPHK